MSNSLSSETFPCEGDDIVASHARWFDEIEEASRAVRSGISSKGHECASGRLTVSVQGVFIASRAVRNVSSADSGA